VSTIGPTIAPTLPPTVDTIAAGDRSPWEQGGGAPYDPATEAGVILDLWAESGVTQAGTGVSSWVDRKGLRDFVQGTDANRPTYEAAGLGGRPSVLFVAASTDLLRTATGALVSTSKSYSLIMVVDPVTNAAGQYVFDSESGRLIWQLNTFGATNVGWFDGSQHGVAASTDVPQILRWVMTNGGTCEIFRGNTSLGSAAYTGTDLGGTTTIGASAVGGNPVNARVSRTILSSTLDSARDARIMASLSTYYGIAL
jgi:hypothetical protein